MLTKMQYESNTKIFAYIRYLNSSVLFWSVITLFYTNKGLSFFEIATIQSIGAVVTIILELPSGMLSDKKGHDFVLKIAAAASFLAVVVLTVSSSFYLILLSEILFSIASAGESGADVAIFYDSLKAIGKEPEFAQRRAKISSRQAVIRFFSRLIGPILFSISPTLPFYISLVIYLMMMIFAFSYKWETVNDKEKEDSEKTEKAKGILSRYKGFIFLCLFSALMLTIVSNYSQFLAPYLTSIGFDIKLLGIVTALASAGDYIGSKLVILFKKARSSTTMMFFSAILIVIFLFISGMDNLLFAITGYVGLTMFYSPFTILLSEKLNNVISSKYRATMLSVSNQIDEFFSILVDPVIGLFIDNSGFGFVWRSLAIISFLCLLISLCILKCKEVIR